MKTKFLGLRSILSAALVSLSMSAVLLGTAPQASANTYTLQFFQIDDVMTASITNSAYNQQQMLQESFAAAGPVVDISSFVQPGFNDIHITDCNGPCPGFTGNAGWAYGYIFQVNGMTYASAQCGVFNTYGCNQNSYQQGIVFSTDITFTAPGGSGVSATPLPPTWTMMFLGLGVLGFMGYRRKSKSTLAAA
jgi:hypothetical protein